MTAGGGVWDLAGEAGRLQNQPELNVRPVWLAGRWSFTPSPPVSHCSAQKCSLTKLLSESKAVMPSG